MEPFDARSEASVETRSSNHPRILVVDDEPTVRLVCQLALKSEGWTADAESVSRTALTRILEGGGYDVVLLDYAMPEMDGLQFLEALQTIEPTVRPRVLLASAHADGAVALRAMALGVWDLVAKPLTPEDVRRRIRRILERPYQAQAGVESALALWHANRQEWASALKALDSTPRESVFKNLLRGLLHQQRGDELAAAQAFLSGLWWNGWEGYGPEIWRQLSVRLDVDETE